MNWTKLLAAIAVLVALAGIFGGTYYAGHKAGGNAVQKEFDAYKIDIATRTIKELDRVREASNQLQNQSNEAATKLKATLHSNTIERDELLKRLQSRPSRPSGTDGVSENPGQGASAAGATGIKLYKEDGQFLAGEASRGDQLRAWLATCEADYERAKTTVNK